VGHISPDNANPLCFFLFLFWGVVSTVVKWDYDHVGTEYDFATAAPLPQIIGACFLVAFNTLLFFPGMFLFIRRRHHRMLAARFQPTLYAFVTFFYILSVVNTASLILGKPAMCDVLEPFIVLIPIFIQHFLLAIPAIVIQAHLASQRVFMATPDNASDKVDKNWILHQVVRPRNRLLLTLVLAVCHVGFYFLLRYLVVLPGDCNRTAIFAWACHACVFLPTILYPQFRLLKVRDPFFIRFEIFLTIICNVPGSFFLNVIYAFSPETFGPTFDYRWIYIESSTFIILANLCFPLLLTNDRFMAWVTSRTSKDYISPEDAKSTGTSSTIFALSQGVNVFQAVLNNPVLLEEFTQFTAEDWSAENVLFYKAVDEYRSVFRQTPNLAFERARFIYNRFIKPESRVEVNLDAAMRKTIADMIQREILSENMFDAAQKSVFDELMERDSFLKWQKTNGFRLALERATRDRNSNSGSSYPSKRSEDKTARALSVIELTEVL